MFSFSHTYSELPDELRVFFVDLPRAWDIGRLAELLYGQNREATLNAAIIVVRMPVDQSRSEDEILNLDWEPLRRRLPNQSIYGLYSTNFRHRITPNLNPSAVKNLNNIDEIAFINSLRSAELRYFAESSSAIFEAKGAMVFRLPSRQFATKFLRVGNIQTRKPAIDAVFFWMLPWLQEVGAIITETWTISSISLNASRLLARYSDSRPCRVDMVSQHHDGSIEAIQQLEAAVERAFGESRSILFLLSASMTGNLEREWRSNIRRTFGDDAPCQFLALYKLGAVSDMDHLCDLSALGFDHQDEYQFRPTGYSVVDIDRKSYFPSVQVDRVVRIKQDRSIWECGRDALDAYRNLGFVSCHRDSQDSSKQKLRHHGIFLDVSKIVAVPRFETRLNECLSLVVAPPKIVLVPSHPEGESIAHAVKGILFSRFAVESPLFITFNLKDSREQDNMSLLANSTNDDEIIVVDDVSISGERLASYSRDLRDIGYRGKIHYVVGIARPESMSDWNDRKIQLSFRQNFSKDRFHTVSAVETIILPDIDEAECSWCREEALLRRIVSEQEMIPEFIQKRLRSLQRRDGSAPMILDAFVERPSARPMALTMNSIFLSENASQSDVIASVAHKLAMMRADGGPDGLKNNGFPEKAVINMNCYLGNWFTDSIIRASILRVAKRRELDYADFDEGKRRLQRVRKIVLSTDGRISDLSFELVLASALGVFSDLPFLRDEEIASRIPDVAELFNVLC